MTIKNVNTLTLSPFFRWFLIVISLVLLVFSIYIWKDLWLASLVLLLYVVGYFLPFFLLKITLETDGILFTIPAGFFSIKEGKIKYADIKELVINRITPLHKEGLTEQLQ